MSSYLGSDHPARLAQHYALDDKRRTDFGNQRDIYEDVLLECAPVIPEQGLEEAVFA